MDFTTATLNSLANDNSAKMYSAFTAPSPMNLSRTSYGTLNTLPSPLHLDFPSITPPRSPYGFYGMYSPMSANHMEPIYDQHYLRKLKSNPLFKDLQKLLLQECLQMQVPASLITTLMYDPKTTTSSSSNASQEVYTQHGKLQDKILKVRIDPAISADGLTVETEYSTEVGNIEMNRYRALNSCPDPKVKVNIMAYYDKERLQLIKNTESKLDSLIQKADDIRKAVQKPVTNSSTIPRPEPKLGDGGSVLLQPLDEPKVNAVRQLKFNTSVDKDDHEDEEYDYLNGSVNSEDFDIDEIDVETVDSDSKDSVNIKATTSDIVNEQSESVFDLSPINEDHSEKDLLQQCLKESGISATPDKPREVSSMPSVSNWYSLPDSSTADSPDSLPSKDPMFSDSDSNSNHGLPTKVSTPQPTYKLDFTQPKNINVALNEIQKLCGGPSVSFTPELRRDFTVNYTPDSQKVSPLSEICDNTSGNQNNLSNISWNNVPSENSSHGLNLSASRKRKSCDDVVINIPEENCMNEQVNAVESSVDYQTPVLKTHRMLNGEATNILTNWYQTHVHYPYPTDEEVEQLAKMTNITSRQVKKWMANKRVRCFNTLSITGNQHPIKYKYQGTSRRKRATKTDDKESAGKENCDSTTGNNNKAPYTVLNEESRAILTQWFDTHMDNPYPTEDEKHQLATVCGISVSQVKSWFANKRNRTNNTRKQVPNYFLNKFPEYTHMVNFVGQKREEARVSKRRKINEVMYIQPTFYL